MKVKVDIEWRKIGEPDKSIEVIILNALHNNGYTVGSIFVSGDLMEDKSMIPFSDVNRLPHELIAKRVHVPYVELINNGEKL